MGVEKFIDHAVKVSRALKTEKEFYDNLRTRDLYPHTGQKFILKMVFQYHKKDLVIQCGRNFGKLLPLDTPIPTPDRGFVPFSEIHVGDLVFNERGQPVSVVEEFDTDPNPELYRITFSDGTTIDACKDHQWLTHTKATRKSERRAKDCKKPQVVTTKQISDTLLDGREYNHSIPLSGPLALAPRSLPISPYVLGVWLGDGDSHRGWITGQDEEIWDNLRLEGYDLVVRPHIRVSSARLMTELRANGFLRRKHVPNDYLWGDSAQRLALLQGLMDTDGTVGKGGYCCFDNTNPALSNAVAHLLISLGQKIFRGTKIAKLYEKECGIVHRVWFKPTIPVFRLGRKLARMEPPKKRQNRSIVSVDTIPPRPGKCIAVSGESKLFLAGHQMVPTHNSFTLILASSLYAAMHPNSRVYVLAPLRAQAYEIYWASQLAYTVVPRHFLLPGDNYINKSELRVNYANGSFVKVDGVDNEDAIRGIKPNFLGCDELQAWKEGSYQSMEPNLLAHDATCLKLATPPDQECFYTKHVDWIQKEIKNGKKRFFFLRQPTSRNPLISKERLADLRRGFIERGEEEIWTREYEAIFVPGGASAIFKVFSKDRHVRPIEWIYARLKKDLHKCGHYTVLDPGSTSVFGAGLFIYNRNTSEVFLVDEIYEQDDKLTSSGQIWPRVKEKEAHYFGPNRPIRIYDEAAVWFKNEIAASFPDDCAMDPTHKKQYESDTRVFNGDSCSIIKDAFVNDRFFVAEHCANAIWELTNYHKNDKGMIPPGQRDHMVDISRYFYHESGWTVVRNSIQEDERDDRFYTAKEVQRVTSDDEIFSPRHEPESLDVDDGDTLWN